MANYPQLNQISLFVNTPLDEIDWRTNFSQVVNWLTSSYSATFDVLNVTTLNVLNNLIFSGNITISGNISCNFLIATKLKAKDGNGLYLTAQDGTGMFINDSGKIGVNTTTPNSAFVVNGYTALGTDAPAIKMKKFTGMTGTNIYGDVIIFAHNLTSSKIIGITALCKNQYNGTMELAVFYSDAGVSKGLLVAYDTTNIYLSYCPRYVNQPYILLFIYEE